MAKDDDGAVIDRMFGAIAAGDLEAARACFIPRALIWHGFDGIAHELDAMTGQWRTLVASFVQREVVDVRRQQTADGFVQQHVMVVSTADGARKAWPVCIVVRIENGLISRLDEYLDRAGSFTPPLDGPVITPGTVPA